VLDRLLGLDAGKSSPSRPNLAICADAARGCRSGAAALSADVVFLTNPVSMEQLKEVAFAG